MISEFRLLSTKDLMTLLDCPQRTADRIKKDIIEDTKAPRLLFKHFLIYFKLENTNSMPNIHKITPRNAT